MNLDRRTMIKIMFIVAFGVLLMAALVNGRALLAFAGDCARLLSPFIAGGCVAFIANVPMRGIEMKLFRQPSGRAGRIWYMFKRPVGILLSFLLMGVVIALVLFLAIPGFAGVYATIKDNVPKIITFLQDITLDIDLAMPQIEQWLNSVQVDWAQFGQNMLNFLQTGMMNILTSAFSAITVAAGGILRTVLAVVFAVYVLAHKERLAKQARRALMAYLPRERAESLINVGALSNHIFTQFVAGQCAEALILGTMCLAGMLIFGFPNPVMISALIGFGNLIPIVGALICTAVGAFLILLVSPIKALWFVVFIIAIQQVDNNLIYPRVVGTKVGLPAIWVLFAVTIGGSFGGLLGMLAAVPVVSVLYALLQRDTRRRLKERGISID